MSSAIPGPAIVRRPVTSLVPNPRNARRHPRRQVRLIASSIRAFGFVNPILVDEGNRVLAGHGRLEAAKMLGIAEVPTLCVAGLSEAQMRAYVLADNRLAEEAGWDREMLALELGELAVLLPTLSVDWNLEVTGFGLGEADAVIHDHADSRPEPEDETPAVRRSPLVSRRGELWQLGPHRVLCGDARSRPDLERLMGGERTRLLFADPPYNVRIKGHVTRRGDDGPHDEFAMASGEMSDDGFRAFLDTSIENAISVSLPGAVHYVCMDWRHIADLLAVGEARYGATLNLCVWNKGSPGQGSFYRSQHELVAVFQVGDAGHQNNVELGRFGRNRSNVWNYPGVNGFGPGRREALAMHPTVKPVALVADAMRDCSTKGALVLDPFLGSGTTLIAAEKVARRCYGIEYEPGYVDVIVRRWMAYAGGDAVLDGDGRSFEEIEAARSEVATPAVS